MTKPRVWGQCGPCHRKCYKELYNIARLSVENIGPYSGQIEAYSLVCLVDASHSKVTWDFKCFE